MTDCCAVLSNIVTDLPYTQLDMNASNEIHNYYGHRIMIMCVGEANHIGIARLCSRSIRHAGLQLKNDVLQAANYSFVGISYCVS